MSCSRTQPGDRRGDRTLQHLSFPSPTLYHLPILVNELFKGKNTAWEYESLINSFAASFVKGH